jgi:hypothetical protein
MDETRETIAALDKLIDSGNLIERDAELLKKLRGMVVGRDAAVEKIKAFRSEFERACGLFFVANEAVHSADDYASTVDVRIATQIDEHLRAVDNLCRCGSAHGFGGPGDGFGEEHLFPDNDEYPVTIGEE